VIDEKLMNHFSPLERESLLTKNNFSTLAQIPEWSEYQAFLSASLRVLFERFSLQWTFNHYTFSSQ
jgi:hypothetical protein